VAGVVRVDPIGGEAEGSVGFSALRQQPVHGGVDVDHEPAVGPLRDEPVGIGREHGVIVVVGRRFRVGRLVVGRWREVDDPPARLFHGGVQPLAAGLELPKPSLVERLIRAAVHPVAGEHEVGPGDPQHAVEAFGEVGTGKPSLRMAVLRDP